MKKSKYIINTITPHRIVSILLLCGLSILLTTCTKHVASPDNCFNQSILPVFIVNCAQSGCHDATSKRAGYNLTSYDGIMKGIKKNHALQSEIYREIRGNNPSMPPKGYSKLSSRDVLKIKNWINFGAPQDNFCSDCDTTLFGYTNRVEKIVQTWCVVCHKPGNTSGNIDLSNYSGVASAIKSNNNAFLNSILHAPGYSPMPKGAKLGDCEINAIKKWISGGYPEN